MDKLAATLRAPFLTLPFCLLLVACVEEDYGRGSGTQGGGSSGDAPANPADCALGTWEIVMELDGGDCFLPGTHSFETTYTVTGGNGSYTVVDRYGNPVSLYVAFPIGAECHAEFIQEQERLITVMDLGSDANANIVGQGTFFGDNGCVTDFTASGTRW